MSLLYGIELELYYLQQEVISIPSRTLPLDGCGAIVELRSSPHNNIYDATFEVKRLLKEYIDKGIVLVPTTKDGMNRHKFTDEQHRQAMKQMDKDMSVEIQNIFGKKRRLLPRSTVAVSLQLNISNCIANGYKDGAVTYPSRFGLLDTHQIVSKLSEEFSKEIEEAKRVNGEYAIKDGIRLEYRSLPSSIFFTNNFEQRVLKVMNSIK